VGDVDVMCVYVYIVGGTANFRYIPFLRLRADLNSVVCMFINRCLICYREQKCCDCLGLKLLFTAVCLTLVDYFVILYGSAIPRVKLMLLLLIF
jgi:hypothetical protein